MKTAIQMRGIFNVIHKCARFLYIFFTSSLKLVQEANPLTWKFWQKRRYIIVVLAFLGYVSNYSLRVNLSVAIVAMTEVREITYENGTIGYVYSTHSELL